MLGASNLLTGMFSFNAQADITVKVNIPGVVSFVPMTIDPSDVVILNEESNTLSGNYISGELRLQAEQYAMTVVLILRI